MRRGFLVGTLATVLAVGALAGYAVRSARADGVPAASALTYAGELTDANGVPLTGTKNIQVSVWTAATAGTKACEIGPEAKALSGGHFEFVLPDACTTQVHAKSDLWVEVIVDGQSLGRSKIGAVPYALEAAKASEATGALKTTMSGLANKADVPVITAWQSYAAAMKTNTGATVSAATSDARYRRVGDSIEVVLRTTFHSAPNSGAVWYHWTLPPGLVIDTSKLPSAASQVGGGSTAQGASNNIALMTYVRSSTTVSAAASRASTYYVNDTIPFAWAADGYFDLMFTVPIVGWTATQ